MASPSSLANLARPLLTSLSRWAMIVENYDVFCVSPEFIEIRSTWRARLTRNCSLASLSLLEPARADRPHSTLCRKLRAFDLCESISCLQGDPSVSQLRIILSTTVVATPVVSAECAAWRDPSYSLLKFAIVLRGSNRSSRSASRFGSSGRCPPYLTVSRSCVSR